MNHVVAIILYTKRSITVMNEFCFVVTLGEHCTTLSCITSLVYKSGTGIPGLFSLLYYFGRKLYLI